MHCVWFVSTHKAVVTHEDDACGVTALRATAVAPLVDDTYGAVGRWLGAGLHVAQVQPAPVNDGTRTQRSACPSDNSSQRCWDTHIHSFSLYLAHTHIRTHTHCWQR